MNKNIENFLNEYMINPDPQYAVFLKGNWGCGKTFFVNNWLNSYKKKIPEEQILKPVMVSLYGLSEIKQITAAINKALYPILCGRAAKVGKTLTRFLSATLNRHWGYVYFTFAYFMFHVSFLCFNLLIINTFEG